MCNSDSDHSPPNRRRDLCWPVDPSRMNRPVIYGSVPVGSESNAGRQVPGSGMGLGLQLTGTCMNAYAHASSTRNRGDWRRQAGLAGRQAGRVAELSGDGRDGRGGRYDPPCPPHRAPGPASPGTGPRLTGPHKIPRPPRALHGAVGAGWLGPPCPPALTTPGGGGRSGAGPGWPSRYQEQVPGAGTTHATTAFLIG